MQKQKSAEIEASRCLARLFEATGGLVWKRSRRSPGLYADLNDVFEAQGMSEAQQNMCTQRIAAILRETLGGIPDPDRRKHYIRAAPLAQGRIHINESLAMHLLSSTQNAQHFARVCAAHRVADRIEAVLREHIRFAPETPPSPPAEITICLALQQATGLDWYTTAGGEIGTYARSAGRQAPPRIAHFFNCIVRKKYPNLMEYDDSAFTADPPAGPVRADAWFARALQDLDCLDDFLGTLAIYDAPQKIRAILADSASRSP